MITAIIQARINSKRLQGKVMMPIMGKPLLYYVINQLKHSKKITRIIVATSNLPEDDKIQEFVETLGIKFFRGHPDDVLDRYYRCATYFHADPIVRITADDPLIDPALVDRCITKFEEGNFDYVSNSIKKGSTGWFLDLNGFPAGFAVSIFSFNALKKAWQSLKKPSQREHVVFGIEENINSFKFRNIKNSRDLSHIRLTVDYQADFDVVKTVIESFPEKTIFTLDQVVSFLLDNPEVMRTNSNIPFDEGYVKSLKQED